MLTEVRVAELGVIAELSLMIGPGMTALTGETGAGKTLVVEAIELLLGGRADPVLVRPGAEEAVVAGRFAGAGDDGDDLVLERRVPLRGRSRAYVDGRMAPLATLAEAGSALVDLHGQHTHQSLLAPAVQRAALDSFGEIDPGPVRDALRRVREADRALEALGGDSRARVREMDLLAFQVGEIGDATLDDPDEELVLAEEEDRLADAAAHRAAALAAYDALMGERGASDGLGHAVTAISGRGVFAPLEQRLRGSVAELDDLAGSLRALAEGLEDDPARLVEVRARVQLLRELRRKYGEQLREVMAFGRDARARLAELAGYEERARVLEAERATAVADLASARAARTRARRLAAPHLAAVVEEHLHRLAMPKARFEVHVGDDADDDGGAVAWMLAANPGEPALPLTKVASGGELARTMLAARLALAGARPPTGPGVDGRTLIFDEVDAGVGGEAAVAVGRALAELATRQQVLVVTHLAQVAAFADHQIALRKREVGGRTVTAAQDLDAEGRVIELSRMLSGQPDSETARRHAEELLAGSSRAAGSPGPDPAEGSAKRGRRTR